MSDTHPDTLVYIAYARADRARIEPVVAALRERGVKVSFDAATAHGSGGYVHESQRALRQAGALIVFVSQASTRSPWVESETRAYQAQMARGAAHTLIPVRLDDTPTPVSLAPYAAVDGVDAPAATLADALITRAFDGAAPANQRNQRNQRRRSLRLPPQESRRQTRWSTLPMPARISRRSSRW